ncbi:MFS transporter [Thermodesulfobacteriota bacterium]
MDSRERHILVGTCFGHFMCHVNMLVFPAILLPLSEMLSMKMTEVLAISFWMYLLFGLTALPWGLAADRWKARPLLLIFYLGAGFSSFAAAFWMDSLLGLSLALAGIGLFSGIYHPTGLGLISKEIRRVSIGMGYNGMFGNLGLATAPLIAGIVNWLQGPRATYVVLGMLNLAGAVLIFMFAESEEARDGKPESGAENGYLIAFVILLVAMMLGGVVYRGATVITPAYFELKNQNIFQWLSMNTGEWLSKNLVATSITSFIFLIGMLGQYGGGRMAEKFEPKYCYLGFHVVTVPVSFAMAMTLDLSLVVLAMIYFFFLLGMQPIENTLVAVFTPKKFHHSAFGTKFVLTFGVGALAVYMIKAIETAYRIETVFIALGLISLALVGVITLLIYKTRDGL